MAALYITSPQAGAGKTLLCAGLGKHLKGKGKKVGFFKPLVADIKGKAADSDTASLAYTTSAGPTNKFRSRESTPAPPSIMCTGASTWVPLCAVKSSRLTVIGSPYSV